MLKYYKKKFHRHLRYAEGPFRRIMEEIEQFSFEFVRHTYIMHRSRTGAFATKIINLFFITLKETSRKKNNYAMYILSILTSFRKKLCIVAGMVRFCAFLLYELNA